MIFEVLYLSLTKLMTMKKSLLYGMLCAAFLILVQPSTFASHIVGTDLYYTHISGSQYKITVVLYGDCGPMSSVAFSTLPTSAPHICIYDGSTYVDSISLPIQLPTAGVEITPLCTGDTSQCTNPSSIRPGVKRFVYSANYTLPHTSAVWRFIYSGGNSAGSAAGRASAITNLVSPGTTIIALVDTLNNLAAANSSPILTVSQQTFFCNAQHDSYLPTAVDPDTDSLSISLVDPLNGTGTTTCPTSLSPVAFTGTAWTTMPISATEPLQVLADSFTLNPSSGNIGFHPSGFQRGVLVYNIREYRAGTLVGTSQREMTVLVVDCATTFPCMLSTSLGTAVPQVEEKISIYPNPADGELTVTSGSVYNSFTISNMMGQVLVRQAHNLKTVVNTANLPSGLYIVNLKTTDGEGAVRKFIKR